MFWSLVASNEVWFQLVAYLSCMTGEIAAQRPTQPVKSCAQPWQKQRTKVAVLEKFDGYDGSGQGDK